MLNIVIEQTSVEAWNGIGKTCRNQSEKYHVPIFCGTGEEVISTFDSCCGILPKKQYYGFSITVITSPPIYECHFMIVFVLVSLIIFVGYSMTFFGSMQKNATALLQKSKSATMHIYMNSIFALEQLPRKCFQQTKEWCIWVMKIILLLWISVLKWNVFGNKCAYLQLALRS